MSLKTNLMAILCKVEATPGVDAVPTGAANAMLVFNPKISPMMGQDAARDRILPYFAGPQNFPTNLYQTISFETELVGNAAAGTAPAWSPLAQAAGFAEVISAGVSVAYNPISSGAKTVSIYYHQDGQRHVLLGARGNAVIKVNAHSLPIIEWTFTGIYADPTNVANPTPTLTSWQDPQVPNKANTPTFTINGFAAVMRSFSLDMGNKIVYRELINSVSVEFTDRAPSIQSQIEAVSLASLNPFTLAKAQTSFAVSLVHGVGAGRIVTLAVPYARMNRPGTPVSQDNIVEWPLSMQALPSTGNDEVTITLT